jgi:hypothetical protein
MVMDSTLLQDFHKRCDNMQPSSTLLLITQPNVFIGSYTVHDVRGTVAVHTFMQVNAAHCCNCATIVRSRVSREPVTSILQKSISNIRLLVPLAYCIIETDI